MSSINDRLKEVRKALGMTQVEFGEKILLSQGRLTSVESGKGSVTERTIHLVCSSFNVSESWLRTGEGSMFLQQESRAAALARQYSFPEICLKLLSAYDALPPDQQAAVLRYAQSVVASLSSSAPSPDAAARDELAARAEEEALSPSSPGSGKTA